MLIENDILRTATKYLGKHERHNLLELKKFVGLRVDQIPWCAAFVNSVLKENGIKGTGSNLARSFLKWGKPVELQEAKPGDIVVFKRGNSTWQGHVAFFVESTNTGIRVLGGNQGDRVSLAIYRFSDLLGVRTYL